MTIPTNTVLEIVGRLGSEGYIVEQTVQPQGFTKLVITWGDIAIENNDLHKKWLIKQCIENDLRNTKYAIDDAVRLARSH